jgi:hypothetical protein
MAFLIAKYEVLIFQINIRKSESRREYEPGNLRLLKNSALPKILRAGTTVHKVAIFNVHLL